MMDDERKGGTGRITVYLPKNKTHLFIKMIAKIAEDKGSLDKALSSLHMNGATYDRMTSDSLIGAVHADRIIEAYKKINANKRDRIERAQ